MPIPLKNYLEPFGGRHQVQSVGGEREILTTSKEL